MLFRRSALTGLSVTLMCLSGYAVGGDHGHHDHDNHGHEQRSHVHGVAELMLAQEGNELEIMRSFKLMTDDRSATGKMNFF